jgi:hypothetical protein
MFSHLRVLSHALSSALSPTQHLTLSPTLLPPSSALSYLWSLLCAKLILILPQSAAGSKSLAWRPMV